MLHFSHGSKISPLYLAKKYQVDSGKSVYEKFISGASYIQLYTGMVYQGPNIVNKISEELNDILTSNGVKNIEEIIGSKWL